MFPQLCNDDPLKHNISQFLFFDSQYSGSTQEALKWSSKGAQGLYFCHATLSSVFLPRAAYFDATTPFSCKTLALSWAPAKWPWLADPSATYRTRGQSVPCFAFESVIISLFPVWSQHFTSSSDFQILATAPISKVFGTLPYRNWYQIAIFIIIIIIVTIINCHCI